MKTKKCHFVGIGGIGMSGLAKLLLQKDYSVSGSDQSQTPITNALSQAGASVFPNHSAKYIEPDMTVVYSSAVPESNPEIQAAKELMCPLMHRSDLLFELSKESQTLAVAGTHGKTSSSALLTHTLQSAGMDPSFAVGGMILNDKGHAQSGEGEYFVLEADESDGSFEKYHPMGAILTNIDSDHLDHFGSMDNLINSFKTFISHVKEPERVLWNGDDPTLRELNCPGFSYGFGYDNHLVIKKWKQTGWTLTFTLHFQGKLYRDIELASVGKHNVHNAAGVFGLALLSGASEESIRDGFKTFPGVSRRAQRRGEESTVLVIDDYAHHPVEIKTTLAGIRQAEPERRMIAVFQPHRYSRTKECLGQFGDNFDAVDEVIVTDVYSAGEQPISGVSHEPILHELSASSRVPSFCYVEREKLGEYILNKVRPHDIVVLLGAGDITRLGGDILDGVKEYPPKKWKVGLVFGGNSLEHEVSISSAKAIHNALNYELYEVVPFGITKEGSWITGEPAYEVLEKGETTSERMPELVFDALQSCDVLFPALHGPYGEDGCIQGLFEVIGKPYVGCGHRASAIAMDKNLTKRLCETYGIATAKYLSYDRQDWLERREDIVNEAISCFHFPIFIKPTHLGSTYGVIKIDSSDPALVEATIDEVLQLDTHLLIEEGVKGREVEFAVTGNVDIQVAEPLEILTDGDVYDYNSKYTASGISSKMLDGVPDKVIKEGKAFAARVYKALGCEGMARIDCFLDEEGDFILNEVNPIPGCTPHSAFPLMWRESGVTIEKLVDKMVVLALHKQRAACV